MIPKNHFLRVIEEHFDWNFIYDEVEKIIKYNEEVDTEEVIGEKEIIVSDIDKSKQRTQHIERVFADGKMKYGLRKTYFRTKERVHRGLTILYA